MRTYNWQDRSKIINTDETLEAIIKENFFLKKYENEIEKIMQISKENLWNLIVNDAIELYAAMKPNHIKQFK